MQSNTIIILKLIIISFSVFLSSAFRLSNWDLTSNDETGKSKVVGFSSGSIEYQFGQMKGYERIGLKFLIFDRDSYFDSQSKYHDLSKITRVVFQSTELSIYFFGNDIKELVKKENINQNSIQYTLRVFRYEDNSKTFDVSFLVNENANQCDEILNEILNNRNKDKLVFLENTN